MSIKLLRTTPAEKWGLRLSPEGHLIGVVAESPAYRAVLQSAPHVLNVPGAQPPQLISESHITPPAAANDLDSPPLVAVPPPAAGETVAVSGRVRVVGVEGVPVDDGAQIAAAIAAKGAAALEVSIVVKEIRRTLPPGKVPTRDVPRRWSN
jgi:hypothetical protein